MSIERESALEDLKRLEAFPFVRLALWPSRIDEIDLGAGPKILIKRDDLCGYGHGRGKARKIEHLLGYMQARGYDTLVTVAGNVTNLVHDILPALDSYAIEPRLLIINSPPMAPEDRAVVFEGVRDRVELLGSSYLSLSARTLGAMREARRQGRRPLFVLTSLAHPAGVAGAARGFLEMVQQRQQAGLAPPRTVYIAASSGSTLAGFLIAEHSLRRSGTPPIRVIGVQVHGGPLRLATLGLVRWTERVLGLEGRVPSTRIEINSGALHGGFARFSEELCEICDEVEHAAGVRVDPIFGGKTWALMLDHARGNRGDPHRPVLFWHSGYNPEWARVSPRSQRLPTSVRA